jgi:hypothetical protein
MIPYEELVAALDRYVSRNGGTPQSARGPSAPNASPSFAAPPPVVTTAAVAAPRPSRAVAPPQAVDFDEAHDPDLPPLDMGAAEEDATHVGAMPGAQPPPLARVTEEHSNEIDIGDVLADDEL